MLGVNLSKRGGCITTPINEKLYSYNDQYFVVLFTLADYCHSGYGIEEGYSDLIIKLLYSILLLL